MWFCHDVMVTRVACIRSVVCIAALSRMNKVTEAMTHGVQGTDVWHALTTLQ